jgi:hypothetical protein
MHKRSYASLWLRWVIANSLGEMFGLGLTFGVGVIAISRLGNQNSPGITVASFLVAVISGAIEATLVGLAQWQAMYPWFPMIARKTWWSATLVGALIAYVMGYLPSTLMSLGEQAAQSQADTSGPAQWVVLLLAGGLGLVGGAVLSFAQWLTMRHRLCKASRWIPANMLAWLVGMPLIFWSIDAAQAFGQLISIVVFMAGMLLITGLVVGAIHGYFLVQIAKQQPLKRVV